jgi:hypothetical protein
MKTAERYQSLAEMSNLQRRTWQVAMLSCGPVPVRRPSAVYCPCMVELAPWRQVVQCASHLHRAVTQGQVEPYLCVLALPLLVPVER